MLRTLVCSAIALCLFATVGLCGDEAKKKKKKADGNSGEIVKVDPEKGTITVKVAVTKKQFEDKEIKITDATTVLEQLKGASVAELLKKEQFKTGTTVKIETGDDSTAKSITLGVPATPTKKKKKDK